MLHLLLEEGKNCAVRQIVERVVVELAHWHRVRVIIDLFFVTVILDELLHVPEHMVWLTAFHDLIVFLFPLFRLLLLLREEFDLRFELIVSLLIFSGEYNRDFFENCTMPEHLCEGAAALPRPVLLVVFGLLHLQLLKRRVLAQDIRQS